MKTQKTTIQNKPKTRAMTERVTARNPILALLLRLLWAAALVLHTSRAQAGVVFTTLHSFTANSDGAAPLAGLLLSGNTLYGTASGGGTNGSGTVFSLNTDATGFTMLHSFTALDLTTHANNSDGGRPEAGLILSGNTLYGTAYVGGTNGSGTVFAVNTNGTGFAIVYSFTADFGFETTNSDGAGPLAALISSGSTLYGTTYYGGSSGKGTVFAVSTAGTLFTNLYSFTALSNGGYGTNSDGANPNAGLILSSNTLFGTAFIGGTNGNGTVFALNTDGTGFTPPTVTELIQMPVCFYRATPCMGRHLKAGLRVMARCSRSTPMAQVLRTCIISRQPPVLILTSPTAMEFFRTPD